MQIQTIHQIELTSRCNLRCPYCVQSNGALSRPRVDMGEEVWQASLTWVQHFIGLGTQGELNIAGTGESTLHPRFVDMLLEARQVLGPDRNILFATNGIPWTEDLVKRIAPARPQVYVSLHAPALAAKTVRWLKDAGLLVGLTADPATSPNDWAGQVDWIKPDYRMRCSWVRDGWGFVSSTGDLLTCCLDAAGGSVLGNVLSDLHPVEAAPWSLCSKCYQDP